MSASAESNGTMNGHAAGTAVLDRVRAEIAKADAKNQPRPSQAELAESLATSRHHVRKALAALANQPTSRPSAPASRPAPWRMTGDLTDGRGHQVAWRPPAVANHPATWRQHAPLPAPAWRPAPQLDQRAAQAVKPVRLWPVMVIGLAAFVALWSGWVGLGAMTGFGPMRLLPGIWDSFVVNTAVVLPISLEAYAWFALRVLLTGSFSARTTRFAKRSAWFALGAGGGAQASYHLMEAAGWNVAPWPVTMLVSVIPIAVLALAASLAHLVRQDRQAGARR